MAVLSLKINVTCQYVAGGKPSFWLREQQRGKAKATPMPLLAPTPTLGVSGSLWSTICKPPLWSHEGISKWLSKSSEHQFAVYCFLGVKIQYKTTPSPSSVSVCGENFQQLLPVIRKLTVCREYSG